MHMFATIALCLREGNKEFREKDKEDLFFNHVIFSPCLYYDVGKVVSS